MHPWRSPTSWSSDVDTGETITATLTLADTSAGSLSANDGATYTAGTGVWTITDTVANVNLALANLVFTPAVNNDVDTTIGVVIDDGDEDASGPLTGTITLDVSPVNDAPTATNLTSTSAYNEGDASVAITDIVVSDVDTGETITATLTLADTSAGSLSANNGATYTAGTGVWTITDTVANVNLALANLVFTPAVNNDVDTTIGVVIDDGDEDASGPLTGTITLDVTPVNDAPTASGTFTMPATDENTTSTAVQVGAMLADASITANDPDGDMLGIAVLAKTGLGNWQYSTNGASGWTDFGTVNPNAALLLSETTWVRYVPDGVNGEAVGFDFKTWDQTAGSASINGTPELADTVPASGGTGTFSNGAADVTLTVSPVNDAPTATNLTSTSAYNEGDASVAITDIVVSDVDTGETITATLTLADTSAGSLSANNGATYTAGTGVWTITDTVANVNLALANLVFTPAVNNDVDTTIGVVIDDGDEDASGPLTGTITLDVSPVNDAPTATNLTSTSAYNEGDASVAITDIVVSDVDTGETITATLTLADTATGSLSANNGATYTAGTGVWTITDTVANVNLALANLVFTPAVNNDVDTTIGVVIDDGDEDASGPLTGTITLDVTPVNDAPTASGTFTMPATDENTTSTAVQVGAMLADASITANDPDGDMLGIAVLAKTGLGNWQYSTNGASGWTDFGTVNPNAALLLSETTWVRYVPDGVNGEAVGFDFKTWDQTAGSASINGTPELADTVPASGGTGTFSNGAADVTLTVSPVNDAPTATNLTSTSAYNEGDASVAITDIVVSDVDTGETITATLTLADTSAGSLSANDGATYTAGTGVWTITDTVANVNLALANLVFTPAVNNDVDTTIGVVIDDGDEDASGPLTGTISLDVTPVNVEQVLTVNTGATVLEGSSGNILAAAMLATTDADNTADQLIYTITVAPANGTLRLSGVALRRHGHLHPGRHRQ